MIQASARFSQLRSITTKHVRMSSTNVQEGFPVAKAIAEKIQAAFSPLHLDVINESHMHNVPKHSETHFKVVVVSEKFESAKGLVQRHRMVNEALSEQLKGPVHALSIVAKTPTQWKAMVEEAHTIPPSPKCLGGDGSLPNKNGVFPKSL